VAQEFVDDILDRMLDGWHFGEFDMMTSESPTHRKKILAMGIKPEEKKDVDSDIKMMTLSDKKVARDGNAHEQALDSIDGNIRFGLFLVAIMYFRAMTYLKKEERDRMMKDPAYAAVVAKSQGDMLVGHSHKKLGENEEQADVAEKAKAEVMAENANIARARKKEAILMQGAQTGEARRVAREEDERDIARLHLQELIRRQQLERDRITTLQRVYRGHVGRKVSKRFAMKEGEITAARELFRAAATCAQRHWRGHMGREYTRDTRRQMANFISLQRLQETADDEEAYWDTHPYQRARAQFRSYWNMDKRTDKTNQVINMQNQHKEEVVEKAKDYLERVDAEAAYREMEEEQAALANGGSGGGGAQSGSLVGSTVVSGNTPSVSIHLAGDNASRADGSDASSTEFTTFKRMPGEETPESSVAPTVETTKTKKK